MKTNLIVLTFQMLAPVINFFETFLTFFVNPYKELTNTKPANTFPTEKKFQQFYCRFCIKFRQKNLNTSHQKGKKNLY